MRPAATIMLQGREAGSSAISGDRTSNPASLMVESGWRYGDVGFRT